VDLQELQKNWHEFGRTDPLWAILTDPAKKGGKWDLQEFLRTGTLEIDDVFARLKSLNIPVHTNRALDFGCGIGRLTQALSHRFRESWGVDIAPSMIAFATEINARPERCHYMVNDSNDLSSFPSGHFDFIYSRLVLQHMEGRYAKAYIAEFMRILATDGVLVFQLPDSLVGPAPDKTRKRTQSTEALPGNAYNAEITCDPAEASVEAGSVISLRVTIRNASTTTWPCLGREGGECWIKLGNHWLGANLEPLIHDDARANLENDLEPGAAAEIVLNATAPSSPGAYVLELDMVQEAVAWFADRGSRTARMPIRVVGSSKAPQPNAAAPMMEMHVVPKNEVMQIIRYHGGHIVEVAEDDCAGSQFLSYRYYVQKREQSVFDRVKRLWSGGSG